MFCSPRLASPRPAPPHRLQDSCCGDQDHGVAFGDYGEMRDALNATGRAIYYAICPHARAPTWGTARPYNGGSMYAPPESWTAAERHALANSILVEYTNTFDSW